MRPAARTALLGLVLAAAAPAAPAQEGSRDPLIEPTWIPLAERVPVWAHEVVQVRSGPAPVEALVVGRAGDDFRVRFGDGREASVAREHLRVASRFEHLDAESRVALGEVVEVRWNDAWHQARVHALGEDQRLAVHYIGWAAIWDEVVPRTRARREWRLGVPLAREPLGVDHPVAVERDGRWVRGRVVAASREGEVRVALTGDAGPEAEEALVPRERLRIERALLGNRPGPLPSPPGEPVAAAAGLVPGALVAAEWDGGWYLALVLEPTLTGARVRYAGWSAAWDEEVPVERLRAGFELAHVERRPPPR